MKTQFDWDKAEKEGVVLVNAPSRKIAAFPTSDACITLILKDENLQSITSIDANEAIELIYLLESAVAEVWPQHEKQEAEYAAHEAISKARSW